ncbi:hypothetical protein ACI8AG_09620 [Blastococcus sp. SYSU DS0552]
MIDFAKLAAETTIAAEPEFPRAATAARQGADPALVQLVTDASKDSKRRELPGRFSLKPYAGRKTACEAYSVMGELHKAARQAGVKLQIRRFDGDGDTCRVTFKVAK